MALIFCDGFDAYATSAEVADKWSTNTGVLNLTAGRFSGGALANGIFSSSTSVKTLPSAVGGAGITIGAAGWFKSSAAGPVARILGIGNAGFQVNSATASEFVLPSGTGTAAFVTTLFDNNWHWIEWSCLQEATAIGTWSVSIDNVVVGSGTGVTTGAGTALSCSATTSCSAQNGCFIDDAIFWDSTGSEFNTFPLGVSRISTLIPSGAGASTQYTPSTGTNWSCVAGAYSGTAKVTSMVTGQVDLYTYPNLPIVPSSIYAVVGNYYGQNSGVGSAQNIPKMRTGSTTVSGTASVLPTGTNASSQFAWYADAGGSAWTDTSVNAVQLGMGD